MITVRNEVAKVMFLQVSVCQQGGVPGPGGCLLRGGCLVPGGGVPAPGGLLRGGLLWGGAWSGGCQLRGQGGWYPSMH